MARVLKVIVNVILLCSILTAVALLVPPVMGVTTLIVDSPEKNTNLGLGTVTYATDKPVSELKIGDTILDENNEGSFVYTIKGIDKNSSVYELEDKFQKGEVKTQTLRNTASKIVFTAPIIGYVVMAMQSVEGLIIISLAVVFVIILFVLAELWKKSDEEDELEDGEFESDEFEDDLKNMSEDMEDYDNLSRKERRALAKAEKQEDKLNKKKEKSLKKAQKKADKYGGAVEDYLDEDIPLLPAKEEFVPQTLEHSSVDAILEETAGELAKGIGAVTGEIPVIDESILNSIAQEENQDSNNIEEKPIVKEKKEMPIVIPRLTAEELIHKALAEGDQPKIVEDKENGLTLLDYSDIV